MIRVRHYLPAMLLTAFSFMAGAQPQTPQKPPRAEETTPRLLKSLGGWGAPEFNGHETYPKIQIHYYHRYGNTDAGGQNFIFKNRRIVAEDIKLAYPQKLDEVPTNLSNHFASLGPPAAVIIRGKEISGEERMFIALQRKDYWEFYSMRHSTRPEMSIKWRLEFNENIEPKFAASISFRIN